jgi:nucleotide-binding universal stress UspA family protein
MTDTPAEPTHRIVVGFDASPSSVAALEWAAGQAERTGSTLEILTTWEWPDSIGWALPFPSDYDPALDGKKLLDEGVATVHQGHPDVVVHPVLAEGHAAPVLVEASHGADLLVLGSRGRGGFASKVLGSVSDHCVRHAHCPVFLLRHAPEHTS